ncbi:MAG: polysaccharide biosynthesis/export family protein [Bacteroidales bacterium]|nr:polysaccharide biosynthesis/export family protein [Bacteroidales bacterium]
MKYLKNSLKLGMVALLLAMFFASCVPYKKMLYLKDAQMVTENQSANYINERNVDYKLQPGDNLYIRFINTIDERSAAALAGDNTSRTYSTSSDASIYLHSYTLDENGCIELPLTGKIELKNLTVDGAKEKMQTEINKFVNQTTLIVKLSNFNLTVLGEVARPGMYKVYQSQINLFEAVSMAGNMTNFAKKNEVKIIRQTDTGSEIHIVDMGQADILSSPYYYLKPNDIVYVEPLKIKQWGFTTFPYSTVLSIVTLAITLFNLLK